MTQGTAAANPGTCPWEPCGATRRLASAGPHLCLSFCVGRRSTLSWHGKWRGRASPAEAAPANPLTPLKLVPFFLPVRREPAVSMGTAIGSMRPGVPPLPAPLPIRQEPRGTLGGKAAIAWRPQRWQPSRPSKPKGTCTATTRIARATVIGLPSPSAWQHPLVRALSLAQSLGHLPTIGSLEGHS